MVEAGHAEFDALLGSDEHLSGRFEPPLVMFAIQHDANSYPAIVSCRHFGVSLLAADQADIAARFAVKGQELEVRSLSGRADFSPASAFRSGSGISRP